jgi:hypothetical protein
MAKKTTRPAHRPPSGPDGARVSDYPRLTIRLPVVTKRLLETVSTLRKVPVWQLVDQAVLSYVETLPADERRVITQFASRMAD